MADRHRISSISALCLSLLLSSAGGSESDSAKQDFTERLVNGIRERTYHTNSPPQINPYMIQADVVYGEGQGVDTYLLIDPLGLLARGDDGSLYVYDDGDNVIHRFASDGKYQGNFGRSGEGPGEFQTVTTLYFLGSDLYAYDLRMRRISVFDRDGQYLRSIRVTKPMFLAGCVVYWRGAEQGFMGFINLLRTYLGVSEISHQFSLYLLDGGGELRETPFDTTFIVRGFSSGGHDFPPPYDNSSAIVGFKSNRPLAWSLGNEYRIDFYDPADGSRLRLLLPGRDMPVTAEHKELVYQKYAERGLEQQARRAIKFSKFLPEIGKLIWDDLGRLWVRDYVPIDLEVSCHTYNVFDAGMTWLFRQDLPPVEPLLITDKGYLVLDSDEEENPIIRSYLFVPSEGEK